MRTIAIEEHFLPQALKAVTNKDSSSQGQRPINALFINPQVEKLNDLGALRLKDMDAGGIDFQVISYVTGSNIASLARNEGVKLIQAANDQLAAAVTAHPDRFAGLAALPMMDPQAAADELERAVRSLGFKGAVISGTTNGRFLDDPSFFPILERAAALDIPIYLHPSPPPPAVQEAYYSGFDSDTSFVLSSPGWGWHSELALHSLRLVLAGVFDRLPGLQIIIGHMGEMIPFMLERFRDRFSVVPSKLRYEVPDYFLQNFSITTSGFFTDPPLVLALQTFGVDRIMFAVDYPFSSNEEGRAFLESTSVSEADMEKICHLNAERILKLEKA